MDETIDPVALRADIRRVFDNESPPRAVLRHCEESEGKLERLWKIAGSLGWLALSLPERCGGLNLGLDSLVVLYEEAGRALAPIPLLPTLLAAEVIARNGSDAQRERWLGVIASAEVSAAVSTPQPLGPVTVRVLEDGGSIFLTGTAEGVLDGADADLVLILAAGPDGIPTRIAVEPHADGVEVVRNVTWDRTRSLATMTFAGTRLSADRLLPVSGASEEALASHAALGIAADAIGGSEAILAATIDYMKARQQFGRAIGSFQALKHRVANHKVALVADTALVASAASLAARGDGLAEAEVAGAKAQACSNYVELSRDAIQLHGGVGFTAEIACHLYLKRARLNEALFGSASWHLGRITRHIMGKGFTA